jgi:hypothetical protein
VPGWSATRRGVTDVRLVDLPTSTIMPRICCSFVAARGVTSQPTPTRDDTRRTASLENCCHSVLRRVVWCRRVSRDHDLDTVGVTGSIPVSPTIGGPVRRGLQSFPDRSRAVLGPRKPLVALVTVSSGVAPMWPGVHGHAGDAAAEAWPSRSKTFQIRDVVRFRTVSRSRSRSEHCIESSVVIGNLTRSDGTCRPPATRRQRELLDR